MQACEQERCWAMIRGEHLSSPLRGKIGMVWYDVSKGSLGCELFQVAWLWRQEIKGTEGGNGKVKREKSGWMGVSIW